MPVTLLKWDELRSSETCNDKAMKVDKLDTSFICGQSSQIIQNGKIHPNCFVTQTSLYHSFGYYTSCSTLDNHTFCFLQNIFIFASVEHGYDSYTDPGKFAVQQLCLNKFSRLSSGLTVQLVHFFCSSVSVCFCCRVLIFVTYQCWFLIYVFCDDALMSRKSSMWTTWQCLWTTAEPTARVACR